MKKNLIYESIFAVLALIAVIFAFFDLFGKIPDQYFNYYVVADRVILIIFAFDYFIRLAKSKNKKQFFKENIFDLIAIIPFESLFRVFRIVRLFRVLKLLVFYKRFSNKSSEFLKTNGFIYILYFTIMCILIGSFLIYFAEKNVTINSYGDAVWWAFVTTTTVGYGDISPATGIGRVIAAFLMIIGIGFIGMLTGTIATYFLKRVKKKNTQADRVIDLSDLSEEQFQNVVDFSEYLKSKEK